MDTPAGSPMRKCGVVAPEWGEFVSVSADEAFSILHKALVCFAEQTKLETDLSAVVVKHASVLLASPETLECVPLKIGQLVVLAALYGFKIDPLLVCEPVTINEATFVIPQTTDELGARQRLLARLFPEYIEVCLHKNKFYFRTELPLFILLAILYMHSSADTCGVDFMAYKFRSKAELLIPPEYLTHTDKFNSLEHAVIVNHENIQSLFDSLATEVGHVYPASLNSKSTLLNMTADETAFGLDILLLCYLCNMSSLFVGRFVILNDGAVNLLMSACYFSGAYCGFRQRMLANVFPAYFCVCEENKTFSFAREMPIDVFGIACSIFGVVLDEINGILLGNLMVVANG
jgi:hypothetical protein